MAILLSVVPSGHIHYVPAHPPLSGATTAWNRPGQRRRTREDDSVVATPFLPASEKPVAASTTKQDDQENDDN
jgi:hypothetical protein